MNILFIDGTAGFSPDRLQTKPSGGILTSLTLIPRYLSAFGHRVTVLSAYDQECNIDGVRYTQSPEKKYDVVVFNRNVLNRPLVEMFADSLKVWWLHDICQLTYLEDDGFKDVDVIVALSRYCMESYSDFYSIDESKFMIIPNGVDTSVFYPTTEPRNRNLYICASAPVKGLHPVDFVYYQMKRNNPDFELRLYCNQSLHDQNNDEKTTAMLKGLAEKGVTVLDPVPQHQLADVMRKAWVMLMPNHYPEICSNLLLQAQACGLPVVATNIGSAPEFINHGATGLLTKTTPSDMFWWWKDFCSLALGLYMRPAEHRIISKCSPKNIPDWRDIAKRWDEMLIDAVKEKAA